MASEEVRNVFMIRNGVATGLRPEMDQLDMSNVGNNERYCTPSGVLTINVDWYFYPNDDDDELDDPDDDEKQC